MNANELADSIDKYLDSILEEAIHPIEDVLDQSITMLRHLQAENEMLRKRFGEELDAHHSALRKLSKLRKAQKK